MHREIQIKQFPIVTTHWWPKTRNERFVWENEQYLYRFLPLDSCPVCDVCVRTLWLSLCKAHKLGMHENAPLPDEFARANVIV